MGANAKTIQVTLKTVADVSDVTSNVKQIQKVINQLKLPENLKSNFTKVFSEIEKSADKASQALVSGLKTKGDVSAFTKNMDRINALMVQLQNNMGKISPDILKNSLDIDTTKLEAAKKAITDIRQQLSQKIDASGLQKVEQAAANLSKVSKAKSIQNFVDAFKSGNFDEAEKALQKLEQGLSKVTDPSKLNTYKTSVEAMRLAFTQLISNGDIQNLQTQLNTAQQALQDLGQTELNDLLASFQQLVTNALPKTIQETNNYAHATNNANVAQQQLNSELEQFKSRITYFFGMSNAVNLFQRAIHSAYETVKDLDAVMTETAVVTDFSVGDMWSQLPEYTRRANELGVSIHSAYEAATIYYQQGLKTNEVMAVSNETLKMARIAGLDAATATDRMTNALRGFNMEINETNAQRVDDVYNKLAAISASNVDEISTAMTKVASLANNANMEFETTSAFLAQMIETTRESAETAGTALKTVVARFSEVKELYGEGELLGTDSDGEAIDVNKVSTALRTAGINLNEYLTGMKGLDGTFIELAQKWDSLDIVQQRYIATMAAGSRQQSRFIAMMSDYDRTMELVNAANNSAGAANEMFEKTLDSLKTKVNKLKNAWNEFIMAIADDDLIKDTIDALTRLLKLINKLTGNSGIAKIGVAFAGLKLGKSLFNKLLSGIGSTFMNKGDEAGKGFSSGFNKGISKFFSKKYWQDLATMPKIDTSNLNALQVAQDNAAKAAQNLTSARASLAALEQSGVATAEQLAAAQGAVTAAEQANIAAKATATSTQAAFNTMQQLGLTQEEQAAVLRMAATDATIAEALANGTLTAEQAKQIAAQEISNKARRKGLLSIIATTIAEAVHGTTLGASTIGQILYAIAASGSAAAQWVLNSALYACPLGWILVALVTIVAILAGLIVLIVKLVNLIQNSTPEAKLEAAKEAAREAAEAAEAAAEAFSHLRDSLDSLDERSNEIKELAYGTKEWREATSELNKEILDLVDQYPELAALVTSKGGVLHLDVESNAVQKVLTKYENAARAADNAALNLKKAANNAAMNEQYGKLGNTYIQGAQAGQWVDSGEGDHTWMGNQKVTEQMAKALAGDQEAIEAFNAKGIVQMGDDVATFAQRMAEAEGVQFNATSENIEALKNFGQTLITTSNEISTYYQGMINNVLVGLEGYTKQQIETLSNYYSTDQIEAKITKIEDDLEGKKYSSYTEEDKADYEEYFKSVYGDNFKKIGSYGKVVLREGDDIDADSAHRMYAAAKATEEATEDLKVLDKALERLSKSSNNKDKKEALSKVFAKSEGAALTQGDLKAIGFDGEVTDTLKNELSQMYQGLSDNEKAVLGTEDDFIKKYTDNLTNAYNAFTIATQNLDLVSTSLDLSGLDSLSAGALKGFSDNLLTVISSSGEDAAQALINTFADVTSNLDAEDTEKFASALNSIDWKDADAIDDFNTLLDEMGVQIDKNSSEYTDFISELKTGAKAIHSVDFEALNEQAQSLSSILRNIKADPNNRTFSEDDYNSLIAAEADLATQFVKNLDGEYAYIGSTMETLTGAIIDNTSALLGETETQLENRISAADLVETFAERFALSDGSKANLGERNTWESDAFATNARGYLSAYIGEAIKQGIDLSQLGIAGLSNTTTMSSLTDTDVSRILDALYQVLLDKDTNQTNLTNVQNQGKTLTAQLNSPTYNAGQINGEEKDLYIDALTVQAVGAGVAEQWIQGFKQQIEDPNATEELRTAVANQLAGLIDIYNEATAWGVNQELLKTMGDQFVETYGMAADMAYRLALSNINLNQGVSDLVSSYSDWSDVLKAAKTDAAVKETTEYAQTVLDLKKNIKRMFSIQGDLSNSLVEAADAAGLLEAIATGDMEAIDKLRAMAAEDIRLSWHLDSDLNEELTNLENQLIDFASQWDGFTIDANFDDSQAIEAMNNLLKSGAVTVEQMQDYFNSLGYTPEVEYDYSEQQVRHVGSIPHINQNGEVEFKTFDTTVKEMVAVPSIKSLQYNGPSAPKINTSTKSNAASNQPKTSGGSSEKPSYWENPYDELYNLQERINESLRTREALERRYQKLLKKTATSLSEIRKAYYDQIKQLRAEANLQQAMAQGRARQLSNIANETYTDSEGVQRSFASMGVTKYASYDASTGVITIDWAGLDAISRDASREEEGNAAEAYISRLEELVEGYEEIRDELWEIEDKIEELRDEAVQTYLDFEDRVMEAVVNEYQEQIDAFEAMSDEISDTTDKVLDSIKEEIDLARQIRDNTKTEEEISDMENRLAYLRRDTSGANDLEIMQLEKDLEDARQNYTDTLIDQALDQMQRDADLAAEQRTKQQETLQNQLDIMKENGSLWDRVYTLIRNAEGPDGSFSQNSELVKLLKSNEGFDNLSNIGKAKWWEEATAAHKAAMVGKDEAEDKYGVDADNDGTITDTGTQKAIDDVGNQSTTVPIAPTPASSTKPARTDKEKYGAALAIINGGYGWGSGTTRKNNLEAKGFNYSEVQGIVNKLIAEGKVNSGAWVGAYYGIRDLSPYAMNKFKYGGLADFTGPAWLDGTKSHPELVLDATDSQNFVTLKNILAQLLNGQGAGTISSGGGDNYFDIDISAELGSDYDVDQLADHIKKQIYDNGTYRNVNTMNYLR